MQALLGSLKRCGIPVFEQYPTARLCTFRIGGAAALLARPQTVDEMITAIRLCVQTGNEFVLVGRGSNLLFDDPPLNKLVISTASLNRFEILGERVFAECGTFLPRLADQTADSGLGGLEFACGIPGSVGGGIYMNAGAHGNCLFDVLESVTVYRPFSNKVETIFNHELNSSYRKTEFQTDKSVILSANLRLKPFCDPLALKTKIQAMRKARRQAQPLEFPSAGCCFRRPATDVPIGKFLEDLGVKGLRVGDAAVSKKHAGFIVNLGAASAADVRTLIQKIQNKSKEERGIMLEPELCMILSEK